ncbi:hypothetical protein PTSG_03876 [Salpingoeca rosetta]|uniref:Large ribosomal subunit protein mL54 n=1 Tax=Salpingoeca rosetta (strain ATCC 50818 / BSB-021) TaxID=946362 RepID=F2U5M9_SALR5|nr:uncharacterized protein PTSG_03876 [Salpingoeca rosetta]EGD83245.1 hypothetical protein PTSG_03876 [Salpingoeca rosetta]|eukprot:XP_004995609.1 hypothetical protein PTSG_03876 [Salpingoeca rosetta]
MAMMLLRRMRVTLARPLLWQHARRTMAAKALPTTCPGANINEGGEDPELKPDDQYPEWLWSLAEAPKTSADFDASDKYHWRKRGKEHCKDDNTLRKQGAR